MKAESQSHMRRAERFLEEARFLATGKYWGAVVNRAYYAMFHAATAVLLEKGIERSSHKAVIAAFEEEIAKKRLLDAKYHRFLIDAFELRSECDLVCWPVQAEPYEAVNFRQFYTLKPWPIVLASSPVRVYP